MASIFMSQQSGAPTHLSCNNHVKIHLESYANVHTSTYEILSVDTPVSEANPVEQGHLFLKKNHVLLLYCGHHVHEDIILDTSTCR